MRSKSLLIIVAGLLGSVLACEAARAGVFVVTEFQGTPRNAAVNPTKQMPLWESGIVYLYSDGGPILSAEFSGTSPGGYIRGIFGRMGQRWESSQGNGVYDVTSAGPLNVVNAQSDLSLDSHFLPLTIPGAVYTDVPTEGQIQFPGLNPIPSTNSVGYGSGFPPGMGVQFQGFLKASLTIPLAAQARSVPIAFFTIGGALTFSGDVATTDGTFRVAYFLLHPDVPEPSFAVPLLLYLVAVAAAPIRTRRMPTLEGSHHETKRATDGSDKENGTGPFKPLCHVLSLQVG